MTESEVPTTRVVQWVASVKQRPTVTYDLKAGKTHATRNSHASPCASDARTTRSSLQPTGQPSHHLGDWDLFIDANNHESVCTEHHDGLIRREEARGYKIGSDVNGRPLAPDHPWNRGWGEGREPIRSSQTTCAPPHREDFQRVRDVDGRFGRTEGSRLGFIPDPIDVA